MYKRLLITACLGLAFSSAPPCEQVQFELENTNTIQSRLDSYEGTNKEREATLFKLFQVAGCSAPQLSEEVVPHHKEPNVICVLPGESEQEIVIGAHFDHVSEGNGVVDNWSGASLLPTLFQSLNKAKRRHTFVFVGFAAEEGGLIGSNFYVDHLTKQDIAKISLMVNMDSLGMGPTKVWVSRSDKHAVDLLAGAAHALKLPLGGVNADNVGISDEEPLIRRHVKTVMIHSVTNENLYVLHSKLDAPKAISFHDYYDTYRLMAGYLVLLDVELDGAPVANGTQAH